MQIIHLVLGKANPERMNGVNKVAYNLATTQTALGYDVKLWGITPNPVKNYPDRNFETILFQAEKSKFKLNKALVKAINDLPQNTVFHIHGAFITEFYWIAKLLKKNSLNYVYTSHGSLGAEAMKQNRLVKQVYFRMLESYIIKNAHKVHLLGRTEEENLNRLLPKFKNIAIIPNGQDISAIPEIDLDKSGREAPIFGFLGRIDANHKGLDLLLEGFSIYKKNNGTGTLELIGGGDDMTLLLAKTQQLGISDDVTFYGPKFGDEKFEMTANFDVFLHTSRMEGFPTAVLEAAALHLPCLTSEATNINDYIRKYDAGYPYHPNTPDNIAQQLTQAAEDFHNGKLKEKGENAFKMVLDEFSWESVSKALVGIY